MRTLYTLLISLLTISAGFSSVSEIIESNLEMINPVIIQNSDALSSALPFLLLINVTDTEELIYVNITSGGAFVSESETNELACKIQSAEVESLFNSTSTDSLPEKIFCTSASLKGELFANAINGAAGRQIIVIEQPSILGVIISAVVGFINWIRSLF